MKKLLLFCLGLCFAVVSNSWAQEKVVSGQVTSAEDGSTLPGVNVVIKGTATGAVTDVEGNYKVSVTGDDAILVFSFIGLVTEEVAVGSRSVIDLQMLSDVTQLGEVIIAGVAGATIREKLTISVAKVSAADLAKVPATSVSGALVGKVSGVRVSSPNGQPGGNIGIQLRGDNNLGVGSSPLVIMDGIILEGGLASINVDDIESMEVVKGASASSLYGSRAGNGVIVITSKRGDRLQEGETRITLRNEVGFQEIPHIIDLAEHHGFALAAGGTSNTYTEYDGVTYPAGYIGGYDPGVVGSRYLEDDHYMDNDFASNIDQQRELFNRGMNVTNYVAVSNRSANSNVFASFENNQQEGIIHNTDGYTRQNFRVNYDLYAYDWLKVSASNLFINTYSNTPGGGGGIFFNVVLAEPDNLLSMTNPLDGQPFYLRHNHWSNETNPLYDVFINKREDRTRRLLSNYKATAQLTDWADFEASYSQEVINNRYSSHYPFKRYTLGGTDPYGIVYSEGRLYKFNEETNARTIQTTLNLNHRFSDLVVKGKISYLYENKQWDWYDVDGDNYKVGLVQSLDNFDNGSTSVSSRSFETIAENLFLIGSLDYKDKILFDGMFRRDGSSLFGEDNRYANYFRVSGGYRLTQDMTIPGVQELKIRAAYGTAGMRPGFAYQYEAYSINGGGSYGASQLGNKGLKPSQTAEAEVAINAKFLDIFDFEAIYSMSTTTDQFLNVPLLVAVTGGENSQWQNAGTVESSTLEFNLGANIVKTGDFNWDLNATFSATEQTITELPIPPYQAGPGGIFYIKEGESYGAIYGYQFVRSLEDMELQIDPETDDISNYAMNNEGYVIAAGSEGTTNETAILNLDENGDLLFEQIGDGNPMFTMGIRNSFNWKGLTAYVLVDWKNGGDVYNRKSQWLTRDDRNGIMDQFGKPESEKKALDYYKAFYQVNENNIYWVEDASYVKLREMAIGYTLNKGQLSGVFGDVFQSISLKAIGRNMFTFTGYSGYDPEVGSIRSPYDGTGTYPNFRNYALSLSLDF